MALPTLRRKRARRRKKRVTLGAAPGHLRIDPAAIKSTVQTISYGPDSVTESEVADLGTLPDMRGKLPVLWVNVDGIADAATLQRIGELFGIHRLALEDVANVPQRPKVETYGGLLFVVLQMATVQSSPHNEQVSLFLGPDFVITFQERRGDCLNPVRERIRQGGGRIRGVGADYLAYSIIDAIIDQYFPVLDALVDRIESLEDEVTSGRHGNVNTRLYELRQEARALRRYIWPLRDAMASLTRDEHPSINAETRVYLRDCQDHAAQLIEIVESSRDTANGLMDLHLSISGQRMNEVMKVLTIIATIFMPLSFIAGLYGMNFDTETSPWNMPELHWAFGYPLTLGLMGAVAVIMVFFFWRKGWFRGGEDESSGDESGSDRP
jgi:magnesium transporter